MSWRLWRYGPCCAPPKLMQSYELFAERNRVLAIFFKELRIKGPFDRFSQWGFFTRNERQGAAAHLGSLGKRAHQQRGNTKGRIKRRITLNSKRLTLAKTSFSIGYQQVVKGRIKGRILLLISIIIIYCHPLKCQPLLKVIFLWHKEGVSKVKNTRPMGEKVLSPLSLTFDTISN